MNTEMLRAVLDGHETPGDSSYCAKCFFQFNDGANVVVVAKRPYGVDTWRVNGLYCPDCAPESVPELPHGSSALATGDIGSLVDTAAQSHHSVLCNVVIEATNYAGPDVVPA